MKKLIFIIMCLCFLFGCSTVHFQPDNPNKEYDWYIKEWQKQKWGKEKVDSIVKGCLKLSKYKQEEYGHDHWKGYQEFLKTFKGDCEDIATFIYGTLKLLNCPYEKRIRIIGMISGHHAVVVIKFNNDWKMYNTVPIPGDFVDLDLSKFIVEFDESNIYYMKGGI